MQDRLAITHPVRGIGRAFQNNQAIVAGSNSGMSFAIERV
jgi:hypothetical protein